MSKAPRSTRYASLSLKDLVCLCADQASDEVWEEFVGRVGKPISLAVLRAASLWGRPSTSLVEDLVQLTYLKLWEGKCRLLRDFAVQHPDAILAYLRKIATNVAHDHFKHSNNQSSGGKRPHLSTADVEPIAGTDDLGSQEQLAFGIFLKEVDEYLKRCLTGPDHKRDRMIFWLYFRQGMTTREIASLPAIGLSAKGVGSAIERIKNVIREQIVGASPSLITMRTL